MDAVGPVTLGPLGVGIVGIVGSGGANEPLAGNGAVEGTPLSARLAALDFPRRVDADVDPLPFGGVPDPGEDIAGRATGSSETPLKLFMPWRGSGRAHRLRERIATVGSLNSDRGEKMNQ